MKVIYRSAASADIKRAYIHYEGERDGLGERFLATVRATAEAVKAMPEAYPVVHRQTRRALLHRFPYGLFYRIVGDTIVFVSCCHTSRSPESWKRRN